MAGAISGATMAALAAMIGGAALQYKATTDANKRRTLETQESLRRQAEFQKQAEQRALGEAQKYKTDDRAATQDQIAQELTQEYLAPVESAQQINAQATTTQGDVSGDYQTAKARSNANTQAAAKSLAKLMGQITSAGRMRGNEAIRFGDAAMDIDRIGSFSRGRAGADQLAIQAAGTPDAGMMLGGQLLQSAGTAGLMMGGAPAGAAGGSGVGATASTTGGASAPIVGSTSGGMGLRATGGMGFRMPIVY